MKNIGSYFKDIAQQNAAKRAIKSGNFSYTYGDLDRWTANIARHIYNQIGRHKVVATLLPGSAEYITAILAINMSGNIFMPIDRKLPEQRITKLLDHASASIVITNTTNGLDKLSGDYLILLLDLRQNRVSFKQKQGEKWVDIDIEGSDHPALPINVDGKSNAYLINTSGTTSEPKTIVGRNESLSHFIHWQINEFGLNNIRGGFLTSVGFDVSLRDIFTPLLSGGEVIIPDESIKENITELVEWIKSEKIELLHLVPSIFRLISNEGIPEDEHALKYIFLAGEPLYWKDVCDWTTTAGHKTKLINLYGPSETTLARLFYKIPADTAYAEDGNTIVPLGMPIADSQVYVLKDGEVVPDNEVGEICIVTDFPSNGYLKNEKLNIEKFRSIAVTGKGFLIAYHTGDLGYFKNATIHFKGRMDHQVKIAGNRIEPLEIQLNLLSLPGIEQAFVLIDDSDSQHLKIVGFYISADTVTESAIREHLRSNLPAYMEPHFLYKHDAFPLNINEKVDGQQLKAFHLNNTKDQGPADQAFANNDTVSAGVLEVIRKIFPQLPPNPEKTLMELGISSLKAIQILSALFKKYKVKIPLVFILNNSINLISTYIKDNLDAGNKVVTIERQADTKYIISPTQEQMLFTSYFNEKSNLAYNVLLAYRISGAFDGQKLGSFVKLLIGSHEIFRTSYRFSNNLFVQDIHPEIEDGVFQHIPIEESKLDEFINRELSLGFNLIKDKYLLKVILLEIRSEEFVIIFKTHHITVDILSLQFIKEKFLEYYVNNTYDPIDEKLQYKEFTFTYNTLLKSAEMAESKRFWKEKFSNKKEFELPTDFERPTISNFIGKNERIELGEILSNDILDYVKENNCSLFMFFSTALSLLLRKYGGSNDVVFGIPMTLRDIGETYNNSIGFFVNTLPIRMIVDENCSFSELLKKQSDHILEYYSHKNYPFAYIIDDLQTKHDPNRSPLFNYMVVGIETSTDEEGTSLSNNVSFESIRHNDNTSKFDMSFFIVNSDGHLKLQMEYDINLYRKETVEFLLEQLKGLLADVIHRPSASLNDFELPDYRFGFNSLVAGTCNNMPSPPVIAAGAEKEMVQPKTEAETKLYHIWKEILSVKELSVTDNFFDIGGTSMKAINLITVINSSFERSFTIMDLFIHSNIKAFAEFMNSGNANGGLEDNMMADALEQMDTTLKILNAEDNA